MRRRDEGDVIGSLLLWTATGAVAAPTSHLVAAALLAATARPRRDAPTAADAPLRFAVIVPAHDEELMLPGTLRSLDALDYPRDRFEVVVVADNCTDRTADIATAAGATVLVRTEPELVGKPAVLAWTARHLAGWDAIDAVAVVDADCDVSPNLLAALGRALTNTGAGAAQARYDVGNPSASWLTALRWAAFALDNYVKPLARSRVGLSSGLFGTGMAFRREIVHRLPWHAFLLTEDYEYHLQLVEAGERVAFVPEARISSAMPVSLRASRSQHARWEGGRWQLIRAYVPRMVRDGLRLRDPQRVSAALDRLIPPLTVLVPATAALVALAALTGSDTVAIVGAAVLAAQAAYVVGGLAVARAPARVWVALLAAPGLIAWKGVLLAEQAVRGRPQRWLRTKRAA